MVKTLTTSGNSTALVLDRFVLDSLKIVPGSQVKVEIDGQRLVVTRATAEEIESEAKFRKAIDRTTRKYSKAFKRLAE